ncbi:DNA-binding transcriptional regulator, LysR family [Alteribacillus persepolensis]|uniref:DNA-binding transcriptional regulator, LysR family n=1 Tax=Alteribacillus persepolensis TaxID=568899 RepID=A0A1G8EEE6_9BACI|nr:LysR family transcriptional regulator [Alteribacillus persepolensis]SDH68221.1 DNA-binding transcriptional regulator, LysR family [Alteribacillus persepolensis]
MDYDQLLTFMMIRKHLNFSRAAEELLVTQPTVTARVKNLEIELDCKLFNREGYKLAITDEGELLAEYADQILNLMNQAKSAVHVLREPTMKIGFAPGFCQSVILSTIEILKDRFDVSIHLIEGDDSADLLAKTLNKELDICIVRSIKNLYKELQADYLTEDNLVLIYPRNEKWDKKTEITTADLNGEVLIPYKVKSPLFDDIRKEMIGINYIDEMEIGNIEMIKSMVKKEWGISIIPLSGIEISERDELGIFPLQNILTNVENRVYAVHHRERFTPEYFEVLKEGIKDSLSLNKAPL